MKKYIIFDFDGTIADTFHILEEIGKEYARKYSINITPKEAKEYGLKKTLLKSKFPIWKIPKILPEVRKKIALGLKTDVRLFPGIKEILIKLSKNYYLGILSTNSKQNIMQFLKKYNLYRFFRFVYSDSSIFGKHFVLKRLCKKYSISYKNIIYIGDEDRDIEAAKKLCIKIIAVSWGYNSKKLLKKYNPDYLVDNPKQILKILNY